MSEATAKMTIRLPEEDLLGAKRYASRHRLSLSAEMHEAAAGMEAKHA